MQSDANYRSEIGTLYKQTGIERLNQGKIRQAAMLLDKAIDYRPDFRSEISKASFQLGARTMKKVYFDLAVRMDPHYNIVVFNFLMKKANKASDKRCAALYKMAAKYCGDTCDLIKKGSKRLNALVARIEKSNPRDDRIERYRNISANFSNLPNPIKECGPGIYPFKLAKGEVTQWIRSGGSASREYEFRSDNQKYEVFLKSGKTYRAWAGDTLPRKINTDIRIRASEDTLIFLTIH